MTAMSDVYDWKGREILGPDGDKIGDIKEIYEDANTGKPEWALINSGLFGTKSHFVPLAGAGTEGGSVVVRVTSAQVKEAPGVEGDGELSEEEEQRLFQHYGIPYTDAGSVTAEGAPATDAGYGYGSQSDGHDTSGPTTDDAMTRSEEELRIGTSSQERGRARLRKYVVTEHVQTTVPVQREEVRVEREPITEGNVDQALDGPGISEEEHEVVLHEEQPVVEKRTVPKERVALRKETILDEQEVSEELRKEQIEPEGENL